MTESRGRTDWFSLGAYLSVGLIIALATLVFGLKRLEPGAADMPLRVRFLITPGVAALWPLIVVRLIGQRAKEDRT
ncbi:MAG: hypothetical protein HC937_01130 [Aquincola sp.]|nr:hypothetical protein [Aquincola sp.]